MRTMPGLHRSPSGGPPSPSCPPRVPRARFAALGMVLAGLVLAGCGGSSSRARSAPPSTTAVPATAPTARVTVTPPQGPVGSDFTLRADGFKPGEKVRFTISSTGGKPFTGQPHDVGPDGSATGTYKTTGNAPGDYTVKAAGDQGTSADGQFTVTGGSAPSTANSGSTPASGSRVATTTVTTTRRR